MEPLYALFLMMCPVPEGKANYNTADLVHVKKKCVTKFVDCAKRNRIPWTKEPKPENVAKFHNKCVKI